MFSFSEASLEENTTCPASRKNAEILQYVKPLKVFLQGNTWFRPVCNVLQTRTCHVISDGQALDSWSSDHQVEP